MIVDLTTFIPDLRSQAADVLFQAAPDITRYWPTLESAQREVEECLASESIALGYVDGDSLLGWVGLRPLEEPTWELHPLMVRPQAQGKGVGRALVQAVEETARQRGIKNIFLGSDDEFGQTSLSGKDLYQCDLWEEIKNIRNLAHHPYEFYQKCGYTITGVIPDAGGPGMVDILMCKRL